MCNLPVLHPDQTLYSWCAHAHAVNAGICAIATSMQLFGKPYAALSHDFPSCLDVLVARNDCASLDADNLALRHSLLGYFLPLQSAGASREFLSAVRGRGLPSIKMRLGITASRVGGHHPLKGCASCVDQDLAEFGYPYWHLAHQFPSAMACTRHARTLFIAWDPVTPVHRRDWLMPLGGLEWQKIEIPVHGDRQLSQLLRLSEFSIQLANSQPGSFDPRLLSKCYQRALRCHGFATANGSLRLRSLIDETRHRYRGIEDIPGFEALRAVTPDWPGLLGTVARKSPRSAHPLKHLLLVALLFETWNDFIEAYGRATNDDVVDGAIPEEERHTFFIDEFKNLVIGRGLSISAAAVQLKISTVTATQMARREGIPFRSKPKRIKGKLLQRILGLLRRGTATRAVCEATGVSVPAINRLLAADWDLKQCWSTSAMLKRRDDTRLAFQAAVNKCHDPSVKAIRRIPGNGYMWLYRHDREWLSAKIPSLWNRF